MQIRKKPALLAFVFIFAQANLVSAQSIDFSITANFIFQFTKYFNWPVAQVNVAYKNKTAENEFVIGIIGDHQLADYLQHTTITKKVGEQKIKVVEYIGTEAAFNCNILYISPEKSYCLKTILVKNANNHMLLVTQNAGLANKGSCVNLIVVDSKVKMEINITNINNRKLKVATEFLALGKIIQ